MRNSVSAVGALVIPDQKIRGFEKLYGRARRKLPLERGEVKGRLLNEEQVAEVVDILRKLGCLLEVVAVDSACHSNAEIVSHKVGQEENLTKNLTPKHHKTRVAEVWRLRRQLERTPLQLYVQSCAMTALIYNTLLHANLYYSFRLPTELGEYHWVIDAKDRNNVTPWEEWWSEVILPLIESRSFKEPFITVEGGDYRWHEKFRMTPDNYKLQFLKDPECGEWFNLVSVLKDDFRFSSQPEFGLEAVDILVNAVRRSMAGNFSREGWLPIRQLMVHRKHQYVELATLGPEANRPPKTPYGRVLSDFKTGGRSILPPSYAASRGDPL